MSQFDATFRWTCAGPGPSRYVIGSAPRHASGATGPSIAASSGCASPYEIGSTGIFVMRRRVLQRAGASRLGRRPIPGVSGSPG